MPGFQDKLSSLEDWLTNVERELFPTRDLVKRTVERFPARFGITKDNVVYVKFAQFPATKDKSNRLIFRPGEIVKYKDERVRVLNHIGDRVNIFIPSRQEEVWVSPEKLERIYPRGGE